MAEALAAKLSLPFVTQPDGLHLLLGTEYLKLCDSEMQSCIRVDFLAGALAHRIRFGGGRGQTLAKAMGIKQGQPLPRILDTTAGLARDAYVLANLGCSLTLLERSPILYQLVLDAMERASDDENFQRIQQQGFSLIQDDARHYLASCHDDYDVIYLDPMYPHKKKSALVKKDMQLLQKLIGSNDDAGEILPLAIDRASKRVVVKRPRGSEWLGQHKPAFSLESKATRYDIYLPAGKGQLKIKN